MFYYSTNKKFEKAVFSTAIVLVIWSSKEQED